MTQYSIKIPIERQRFVEGRLDIPDPYAGPLRIGVIMAHGAANDMHEPLLLHLAEGLCQAGCLALRFNFPYRTEGRQRPDSQRVLESAWLETVKWLRNQKEFPLDRLVAGGKSMGARVVSQLAGAGRLEAEAFCFLGLSAASARAEEPDAGRASRPHPEAPVVRYGHTGHIL